MLPSTSFCATRRTTSRAPRSTQVLAPLGQRAWTTEDAIVVVERPVGVASPRVDGLRVAWERTFGDTLVLFLSV